jgi:hypothetical protein
MLIMALIAKPFSQDACGIDCCILTAGEAAEGGFGIDFWGAKTLYQFASILTLCCLFT